MGSIRESLQFHRLAEAEQYERSEQFLAQIRSRRTVREFSPEPVPFQLIENAVQAAASAPSGANQQPWRFVAVGDPALKREIRLAAEAEEKENYERRFPPEWLETLQPFGTNWEKEFLEIAPWLIIVFRLDYTPDGRGGSSTTMCRSLSALPPGFC